MLNAENFLVENLGPCQINSPLMAANFIPDDCQVLYSADPKDNAEYHNNKQTPPAFEVAGARSQIFHDPAWCKAAILTAGGLCPGLNDVIKALTQTLEQYGVPVIYGIRYGYRGLNPTFKLNPVILNDSIVDSIHEAGGSILGSSRGSQPVEVMIETLLRMNINLLFCIGGDGTLRCAHDLHMEIKKRKLAISIVCIPKTIDNDIDYIDRSFGFQTAVHVATDFVSGAHAEANGAYNGVGLVKVMGRDSGFIAAYAALANSYANYCLVPESPFVLEGDEPNALLPHLERRLALKKHAVIIVAEGAGQNLFADANREKDASGNVLHKDIGILLRDEITRYFKERKIEISVKYFDPSYMIRSVPAKGTDAVLCQMLAQNAVHAAMAGRTDLVVGHWNDRYTLVPIKLATSRRKHIELNSPLWDSVKSSCCFYFTEYK